MESVFLKVLNMSLSASVLILAVLLLRLLLRRAPKWTHCVLWALVALRLVMPFSLKSAVSLIPVAEPIPKDIALMPAPAVETGIPTVNRAVNPVIGRQFAPDPAASVNPLQIVQFIAAILWIAGVMAMLAFLCVSFLRARRSVRAAIPVGGGVYICDEVSAPFVLGVFRPRVYLPSNLSEDVRKNVLLHEKAHLLRLDNWWKPLGFLILSVHWFNPLCWLAYILFCRDLEAACDEMVASRLDEEGRAAYSQALLDCSRPQRVVTICPVAFGETGVKARVKSVLRYHQPILWVVVVAIALSAIAAVCFLTNPKPGRGADPNDPGSWSVWARLTSAKPTPTPWTGDGHWYLFQYVSPWGIKTITGREGKEYLFLEWPYFAAEGDAVAIGKLKGMDTDVLAYTRDPKERLIWLGVPNRHNRRVADFIRFGTELPEPNPNKSGLSLGVDEIEAAVLSKAARKELLGLLETAKAAGAPQDVQQEAWGRDWLDISYVMDEIPGLRYSLEWSITRYEDKWILLPWENHSHIELTQGYMLEMDPEGPLCREYAAAVELWDAYLASLRTESEYLQYMQSEETGTEIAGDAPHAKTTAEPTPTPLDGNGHWYTFTVNTWGIMSSTGVKYLALYGPYSLWEDTAVAIGRIKGVPKEVKVYTGDPEERLIWAYVPGVFIGAFLREDVKLPDPDPETGVLAICLNGRAMILSEEARAELLSLQKAMETDGESAEHVVFSTVLGESDVTIELVYDEIPALRYCLWAICRYEGGWAMVTLKQVVSAEKYSYEPDRFLMLDPQGVICRDYLDSEAFWQATAHP